MKAFDIGINHVSKGPEELTFQLPINAKVIKQFPGKNRPDYFIAELEKSILWIRDEADLAAEEDVEEDLVSEANTDLEDKDVTDNQPSDKKVKTEVNYVVIASKKKSQAINHSMRNVVIGIAYVTDESILDDTELDLSKCEYVALGKASALKKWGFF